MKDNKFDHFIKTRLQDHESPVAKNMWQRITGKEKKPKAGFSRRLYILLALLVIAVTGIYYFSAVYSKNRKEIVFNKSNMPDTTVKRSINSADRDKKVSLPSLRVLKQDSLRTKNNAIRRDKQIKNHSSPRFINPADNPGDNTKANNDKKTSGYTNNSTDNPVKKTAKESNPAKPDSSGNAEIKEDELYHDKFSIELYTSPDIPVNGISSYDKPYEQVLKRAGNMQLSYTIGGRIRYEITKKISAKIGLQYARINEKISFTDSGGNKFTSTNRYQYISVPLLLSYKIASVSNLHLSVNTGIILNIVSQYKGSIPSIFGQLVDLRRGDVYNRNVSTNFYVGVDISKRVNRRMDFFAEPWLNYRLKNMVKPFYSFHQKIHTSGLSLGLRYRLFKDEPREF